ncbi:MAG: tetratricopeptide repeat protein [Bacteroidales bacterium]|nr:tetratricopeptide repeat protein [Bacteroidales bacterium]
MAKKKDATEERIVAVEEALSKTEQFIENNQKIITYVVGGLIVVVLLFFGYRKFIILPKEKSAEKAVYAAERYFEQDSLDLALFGDGINPGFEEIIDDYGSTQTGNLAYYYAGIAYLHKKDFENAIDRLKKFSSDDMYLQGMAYGAIGDAYLEMGDIGRAISYYNDAANTNENEFTSPPFLVKAGWAYELNNDWSNALNTYEKVKKNYPQSREARDIDKYIARAKAKLGEL